MPMTFRTKTVITTILLAMIMIATERLIWPLPAGGPEPTKVQLCMLILLAFITAAASAFGVALLAFGWPLASNVASDKRPRAVRSLVALFWLLATWWPHANAHAANGDSLQGLLYIDYGYHVTLIVAALILVEAYLHDIRQKQLPKPPPASTAIR